jgi:hypothetical protein
MSQLKTSHKVTLFISFLVVLSLFQSQYESTKRLKEVDRIDRESAERTKLEMERSTRNARNFIENKIERGIYSIEISSIEPENLIYRFPDDLNVQCKIKNLETGKKKRGDFATNSL